MKLSKKLTLIREPWSPDMTHSRKKHKKSETNVYTFGHKAKTSKIKADNKH
jgi:hypothetical protein